MISNNRAHRAFKPGFVRLAALVLAALTLCAALSLRPARAAEWMQPYLEQVQEWGVMRGDANGDLHEDRPITRAEFVTLVNRAFGYTDVGPNPFSDVDDNAWYAEDICIAHQAGYFQGTSPSTASPMNLVTREQAAVLLGRCLRFQGVTGAANSTFTDMQDIGGWSRGLVQEAADLGIIQGYSDGTFRPKQPITRGQMACFLVRALGTLIQEPGEQTSGGVYGNLTITTPGVKLKDTTVTGNLYLTGGVGLGDVELENVNVLGKIILTGGGEAEGGQHSVILRNVTASSLEVDSLTDQFLSVMAEGLTSIGTTTIRNSAYVEDRTDDGLGLLSIRLDGDEEDQFQLAGNIKQVVNLTPGSTLQIAQGVADIVTVDEKALDTSLIIDNIASIRELNLDTATEVTGEGDISHLNINAPDSTVSMLPDTIYVRPGITSNINRTDMDNKVANESSEDPRLLAGYPAARNIAPTSAEAVFRTNKAGTIRWALTALMDGSVGEEELMNPGSYPKIIRSGTLNATASNTDFTARLTGLTREGSYYVSAMLVDARGRRSTVKVAAFTTPDDTAPNFAAGYPQAPILTTDADGEQVAQIMVMPTKNCQMYYVLLPSGSTAPTAADFRSGALPGNLGSGVVTLRKNTPFLLSRINTSYLQEKTNYDLYLWLNDADNGKSSAVRRVQITTRDITPPTIISLYVKSYTPTTVTLGFALDEPGTLNWAAVTQGASIRVDKDHPTQADQIKIENIPADGKTVVRRGGPVRASRAGAEVTFNVSGLQPETSYDLYYTASDTAGNYCEYNASIEFPLPIRTQDSNAPSAEMWFNRPDQENDTPTLRYAQLDSDVGIQFSETIMGYDASVGADNEPIDLQALYDKVAGSSGEDRQRAKEELARALRNHIEFYTGVPSGNNEPSEDRLVDQVTANTDPDSLDNMPAWIDYREAVILREGGKTRIVFPSGTGIQLQSGSRYFFRVKFIEDTADNPNQLPAMNVPAFATASALVEVKELDDVQYTSDGRMLTVFRLIPKNTEYAPESARWDLVLWAKQDIEYNLFVRRSGEEEWQQLTPDGHPLRALVNGSRVYHSMFGNLSAQMVSSGYFHIGTNEGLPHLRDFTEELQFAVLSTPGGQDGNVDMEAEVYTGTDAQLRRIARVNQGTDAMFTQLETPLERISDYNGKKAYPFTVPSELSPRVRLVGTIEPKSDSVRFSVNLNLSGKVFCMAIPIKSKDSDAQYSLFDNVYAPGYYNYPGQTDGALVNLNHIPKGEAGDTTELWVHPEHPRPSDITHHGILPNDIKVVDTGSLSANSTVPVNITGLDSGTQYILYLVSEDPSLNPAAQALCYLFETDPPAPPKIYIQTTSTTEANLQLDKNSRDVKYLLARSFQFEEDEVFSRPFTGSMLQEPIPASLADQVHTILDAMLYSYPGQTGNYRESVFDHCATKALKDELSENIMTRQNGDFDPEAITPLDPFDLNEYTPYPIRISEMQTTSSYTMIVIATGKDSGLVGFRASPAFRVTQDKNLYVETYSGGGDNQNRLDPEHFYSGKFTIRFTDLLCYQTSPGKYARVDACSTNQLHPESQKHLADKDGTTCINYPNVITFSDNNKVSLSTPAPHLNAKTHGSYIPQQVQFNFISAEDGVQIYFDSLICATNGEIKSGRGSLIVTLRAPDDAHPNRWWLEFTNDWYKT